MFNIQRIVHSHRYLFLKSYSNKIQIGISNFTNRKCSYIKGESADVIPLELFTSPVLVFVSVVDLDAPMTYCEPHRPGASLVLPLLEMV